MKERSLFVGPVNEKDFGPEDPRWLPESLKWNRSYYYDLPTDLIGVDPAGVEVDPSAFSDWDGNPGVWALYSGDTCLDVHETTSIGYEMRVTARQIAEAAETPWDAKPYVMNPRLFSRAKRSKVQSEWPDLRYVVVAEHIPHKLHRELIEAQHAWNEKSVYWNRNYYQPVTAEMVESQLKRCGFTSLEELTDASAAAWESGITHIPAISK